MEETVFEKEVVKSEDQKTTLSVKLSLTSIIALSLVFSFYIYFSYADLVSAMDKMIKERAVSVAALANQKIDSPQTLENKAYMDNLSDQLVKSDLKVLNVGFYSFDNNGKASLISSSQLGLVKVEPASSLTLSDVPDTLVWKENSYISNYHVLKVYAPIKFESKKAGLMVIYMDLASKDKAVRRYLLKALAYALAGLIALAPILYARIRKEVSRPVQKLIETTKEVAKGNLDTRVNLNRNDELGILSMEFDNMAEVLKQKEEESTQQILILQEKWIEAEQKSRTDFLTNLENHRSFHMTLKAELNRSARTGVPMSLLFCDLDRFKKFNDENGHLYGDRAIFEVAEIIRASIRDYDVAARYGGEEFAVILPGADSKNALVVAERIRANIEQHKFKTSKGEGHMTVSIGIATYPKDADDKESLISAADQAMYVSKHRGRNSITIYASKEFIEYAKAS